MVLRTPRVTPFAMTSPISVPSVSRIVQRAKKPATVVNEEALIDTPVLTMARSIASSSVLLDSLSSSYR